MKPDIRATPGGCSLEIQVQPGASRDQIMGVMEGVLKIKVSAPPVDGAANERLTHFLAKEVFRVPLSHVRVVRGERGRRKHVTIEQLSPELATTLVLPLLPPRESRK